MSRPISTSLLCVRNVSSRIPLRSLVPCLVHDVARISFGTSRVTSYRPLLQFPHKIIESQLREIIDIPGMGDMLDGWRGLPRTSGVMGDVFDGRSCQELPAPNGCAFFENPLPVQPGEASDPHIGLSAGMDWFVSIELAPFVSS